MTMVAVTMQCRGDDDGAGGSDDVDGGSDDVDGGTDDGDGASPADKVANVVEQKAASWDKVGLLVKGKT